MSEKYKFLEVYQNRWDQAKKKNDTDILSFENPQTQTQLIYLEYNKFILDQIKSNGKRPKILELGCGRGTCSIYLSKTLGADVTATDYSESALNIAKENFEKYQVRGVVESANIYQLLYNENSFDCVVCIGLMEHIENLEIAFKEILRVLKKDGLFISLNVPEKKDVQHYFRHINRGINFVTNLTGKSTKNWLDKKTFGKTANVFRSQLNAEEFKKQAINVGFKNTQTIYCNPLPTIQNLPPLAETVLVNIYKAILKLRKLFNVEMSGFASGKNLARAHFLVCQK